MGSQDGFSAVIRGLYLMIRCLKTETVKVKNRVQQVIEAFHGRQYRDLLKHEPQPVMSIWIPNNIVIAGQAEFGFVLSLFTGDEAQNARQSIENGFTRVKLVAIPFGLFFSELVVHF